MRSGSAPRPVASADPMLTAPRSGEPLDKIQRLGAAATIPRALGYMTFIGLAVLFVWLTLRVDLIIFAGVLFAISLRRAAEALARLIGLSVGWSLLTVILLILAFCAAIGWFFAQGIAGQITQLSQQLPAAANKVASMIRESEIGKMLMQHLNTRTCRPRLPAWCKASTEWRSICSR